MLEREIAQLPPEELAIFRESFAAFDARRGVANSKQMRRPGS
jgi:hypothetical protein